MKTYNEMSDKEIGAEEKETEEPDRIEIKEQAW